MVEIITPQIRDNLGNEFIARGLISLLRSAGFPDISCTRFFPTKNSALLPLTAKQLLAARETAPVLIPAGSLFHTASSDVLEFLELLAAHREIAILGVSFAGLTNAELPFASRYIALARHVVWRDAASLNFAQQGLSIILGRDKGALLSDLALFAPIPSRLLSPSRPATLWVVDSDFDQTGIDQRLDFPLAQGPLVVTTQNSEYSREEIISLSQLPFDRLDGAVVLERCELSNLLSLIQSASEVVTSRLHVAFIAMRIGVPVFWVGRSPKSTNGARAHLFGQLGIQLEGPGYYRDLQKKLRTKERSARRQWEAELQYVLGRAAGT